MRFRVRVNARPMPSSERGFCTPAPPQSISGKMKGRGVARVGRVSMNEDSIFIGGGGEAYGEPE